MTTAGLQALPVKRTQKTWRQMCIEADPDLVTEDRNPIEYEMAGGKRIFKGNYKDRGPYTL